jgi:DNA-binding NarL/FixJ family response regulator
MSVRIRVLVAEVSGVLRDIIDTMLAAQPDIEIVAGGAQSSAVRVMLVEDPDVVVIGLGDNDPPEAIEELFRRYPQARVLGIAGDGRHAYMHELRPHRVSLGELSPEQLVQVIRHAGLMGVSGRSPS